MAYQYQEYPRRLYKHGCLPCSVDSDEAKAAKLAEGWVEDHGAAVAPADDRPTLTAPAAEDAVADVVETVRGRKKGRTH